MHLHDKSLQDYLFFIEVQRGAIHAVAQAGFGRAIVENMPKVPTTLLAKDFRSNHSVAVVNLFYDVGIAALRIKTWPAAVGIKFSIANKQLGTASCAGVVTGFKMLVVFTGSGVLRAFLA